VSLIRSGIAPSRCRSWLWLNSISNCQPEYINNPEFSLIYPDLGSTDHNNDQQLSLAIASHHSPPPPPPRPQRRQRPAACPQSTTGFDILVLVSAGSTFCGCVMLKKERFVTQVSTVLSNRILPVSSLLRLPLFGSPFDLLPA
jgi:hypothetical protein